MAEQVQEKKTASGVTLYPSDWARLRAISEANGRIGVSAAIGLVLQRFIRQERMVDIVKAQVAGLITPNEALDQLRTLVRTQPARGEHAEVKQTGTATQ